MVEVLGCCFLFLLLIVGLALHGRARARARGDTLDAWCARVGWRRETDRRIARDVGRRVTGSRDSVDHVVLGPATDGREAVAVGTIGVDTRGGPDSSSNTRREDTHLAVRIRGRHPHLAVRPRAPFSWGPGPGERLTGHPGFDRHYLLVAADGVHAAAVLPTPVLDRLTADVADVRWQLRGEWLTCRRPGLLGPGQVEWMLGFATALAVDLEAAAGLTVPAGSPGPVPRTR